MSQSETWSLKIIISVFDAAVEMISATAWCGIVYAIVGGQPMMINGGTGPVLAFTEILYKMSEAMDVAFLTFNAWIGLWICFYMCMAAFSDLNRIISYATRFTDEIFALLIATIFIINSLGKGIDFSGNRSNTHRSLN